jgi:hypothetical protein
VTAVDNGQPIDYEVDEDSEGWWWVFADGNMISGPYPDRETATDDLVAYVRQEAL